MDTRYEIKTVSCKETKHINSDVSPEELELTLSDKFSMSLNNERHTIRYSI